MFFAGYSSFLHHLQPASHNLATIWQKNWRLAKHPIPYLLVCEPVPHAGQQLPESVLVNAAWAALVEACKGVLDDIFRVRAVQLLAKHGQEHGEVDGSRSLLHHALQVGICGVLTCKTTWRQKDELLTKHCIVHTQLKWTFTGLDAKGEAMARGQ